MSYMKAVLAALSIASFMVGLTPARARADDEWTWKLTPYLWAIDISGDVEARGAEAEVDAGFGDLLEQLNFALMGVLEGRRGRWIVASELYASELGDDIDTGSATLGVGGATVTVGPGDVEVTNQFGFLDFRGGYTLLDTAGGLTLDVLAGVRAYYASLEVDVEVPVSVSGSLLPGDRLPGFDISGLQLRAGLMPTGIDRDFDDSARWLDPLVGLRMSYQLRPGLSLTLVGDVGGFGIGSASDLAWNAAATLNYPLSERWTLRAGYRALNLDRDAKIELDLKFHGPIVGVAYTFGD